MKNKARLSHHHYSDDIHKYYHDHAKHTQIRSSRVPMNDPRYKKLSLLCHHHDLSPTIPLTKRIIIYETLLPRKR